MINERNNYSFDPKEVDVFDSLFEGDSNGLKPERLVSVYLRALLLVSGISKYDGWDCYDEILKLLAEYGSPYTT